MEASSAAEQKREAVRAGIENLLPDVAKSNVVVYVGLYRAGLTKVFIRRRMKTGASAEGGELQSPS